MTELVTSIREVGLLQPIVVRPLGERPLRAGDGRAPLARLPAGRPDRDPGHRPRDRRRRHAARRAAGEPAPLAAQPAGGGGRLRAAAGGLRLHPRGARRPGSAAPVPRSATRCGCSSSRRPCSGASPRACCRPATPGRCWRSRTPSCRTGSPAGSSARASACAAWRRSWPWATSAPRARTRRAKPVAPGLADIAERLSDRFETRVKVDLGKSKGRITVEFASLQDLQRIVDVMDPRNRIDRPI